MCHGWSSLSWEFYYRCSQNHVPFNFSFIYWKLVAVRQSVAKYVIAGSWTIVHEFIGSGSFLHDTSFVLCESVCPCMSRNKASHATKGRCIQYILMLWYPLPLWILSCPQYALYIKVEVYEKAWGKTRYPDCVFPLDVYHPDWRWV